MHVGHAGWLMASSPFGHCMISILPVWWLVMSGIGLSCNGMVAFAVEHDMCSNSGLGTRIAFTTCMSLFRSCACCGCMFMSCWLTSHSMVTIGYGSNMINWKIAFTVSANPSKQVSAVGLCQKGNCNS